METVSYYNSLGSQIDVRPHMAIPCVIMARDWFDETPKICMNAALLAQDVYTVAEPYGKTTAAYAAYHAVDFLLKRNGYHKAD